MGKPCRRGRHVEFARVAIDERGSECVVFCLFSCTANLLIISYLIATFKWVRGELIGRGTYGRVYLALNATTGEMIDPVAVGRNDLPLSKLRLGPFTLKLGDAHRKCSLGIR